MAQRKRLKKSGIDKLEKIMLANRKYYNQEARWAQRTDCGTEMCAGGFCLLLEIGQKKFDEKLKHNGCITQQDIEPSASRLLGIPEVCDAEFFEFSRSWPSDLREGFQKIKTPMARVRFYIKMLRTRALANGELTEAN